MTVKNEISCGLPKMMLDAHQMHRALLNVYVNALQAMPDSGVLTTSVIQTSGAKAWVVLRIRDTGAGMAPEQAARAFEPFFSTKAAGTGLGLPIVKGIIEGHGGWIGLESKPGAGTTIEIHLPPSSSP